MAQYTVKIEFKTPSLLGTGEGWGSVVDSDIIFDDLGLPYFPGRRLKGMLRESAEEVLSFLELSGTTGYCDANFVREAFGESGSQWGGLLNFDNLYLPDYEAIRQWCAWAYTNSTLSKYFMLERVREAMTEIRGQTAIDGEGVAADRSLRHLRLLKAGTCFNGDITLNQGLNDSIHQKITHLLALACLNFRRAGTRRNRGFGEVKCGLYHNQVDLTQKVLAELKEVML